MIIKNLKLKNFRCFSNFELSFDNKFVLLEGNNGSGKTSILEAIYYACYLRSFRAGHKYDLANYLSDHFFLQVDFQEIDNSLSDIQIGLSKNGQRSVKLNKNNISSVKEIISRYKVIALTEDDLQLIVGAPEYRRSFLNQSLFLLEPDLIGYFKDYKKNLEQRNRFLFLNSNKDISGKILDELCSWTKQLWEKSNFLQNKRLFFLQDIETQINIFLKKYFSTVESQLSIELKYIKKNIGEYQEFDNFWQNYKINLLSSEQRWQRSLFGVHLDDFSIIFKNKNARFFASRGQQKLILFLLKVVQLTKIQNQDIGVLLLDDFITDFDIVKLNSTINLLADQNFQSFITSPIKDFIEFKLEEFNKFDFKIYSLN